MVFISMVEVLFSHRKKSTAGSLRPHCAREGYPVIIFEGNSYASCVDRAGSIKSTFIYCVSKQGMYVCGSLKGFKWFSKLVLV